MVSVSLETPQWIMNKGATCHVIGTIGNPNE
jgi:hypothetical protein